MKDKYNNEMKNINIDDSVKEKIINKIEKKSLYRFKYSFAVLGVFIVLATFTCVYAKEIKEFINSWSSSIEFKNNEKVTITENNNFKNIPNDAPKTTPEKGGIQMNHDQLEKTLGFHILNYDNAYTNTLYYRTELNKDESIGRVDIWWANLTKESDDKYISTLISMLNNGADNGYILAFEEGLDATAEKELKDKVRIDSLNTDIIIYGNDWDSQRLTITFVYDDVMYQFIGYNYTKEEMLDIIRNLK